MQGGPGERRRQMSTSTIDFHVENQALTASEYLGLAQHVWS